MKSLNKTVLAFLVLLAGCNGAAMRNLKKENTDLRMRLQSLELNFNYVKDDFLRLADTFYNERSSKIGNPPDPYCGCSK